MITSNTTATSADVLARGGYAMGTSVAPIGATGLSAWAGTGPVLTVAPAVAGIRLRATAAVLGKRREQAFAERFLAPTCTPTNDGTTLGIHSPGRPQS